MRALVRFCCQGQLSAECEHPRWTLIFFKGCKFGGLKFKKSDLQILALVKKKKKKMLGLQFPQCNSLASYMPTRPVCTAGKQNKTKNILSSGAKAKLLL